MNLRTTFLGILLFGYTFTFAQWEYLGPIYLNQGEYETQQKVWRERLVKAGISKMATFKTDSKAEYAKRSDYSYDGDGYLVKRVTYKKGKEHRRYENTYDEKHNLTVMQSFKNGKSRYQTSYTFTDDGKRKSSEFRTKNGKLSSRTESDFMENGKVKEYRAYYGKNKKLYYRYVYEYDEENEKRKEHRYNGKGKLLSTVTYDCKPQGELQKKDKNVCEKISLNEEGLKIKTTEFLNGKGKMNRRVVMYDKKDRPVEARSYNYKGDLMSHWRSAFGDGMLQTERWVYKRKTDELTAHYKYTRRDSGLMEKTEKYDGEGNLKYTVSYEYE